MEVAPMLSPLTGAEKVILVFSVKICVQIFGNLETFGDMPFH